jgi:hypothetical protein
MIGKSIEVLAFEVELEKSKTKKTYAEAVDFYKKNSLDFTSNKTWSGEDTSASPNYTHWVF